MNNTARDGGAIKWTKDRPLIDRNVTKFINNTATVYGNDIASYPKTVQLVFISNNDYVNKFNNTGLNATANLSNVASNSSTKAPLKLI